MAYKKLKLWFDKDLAELLSDKILLVYPDFDKKGFSKSIDSKVQNLELKDRVEVIADHFSRHLTKEYKENIKILTNILGPENEEETGMFINYYWVMPIAKYVEKYGLEDIATSFKMIEEITKRNTGEYAIRPYLEAHEKETLAVMTKWSKDTNKHIRRLSSEGGRPRLPWAKKIDKFVIDPRPLIPILKNLRNDKSKYVQKSVANCLNDILKDNIKIGKQVIEDWTIGELSKQRKWIIKHSLRNLIKNDDEWANEIIDKLGLTNYIKHS